MEKNIKTIILILLLSLSGCSKKELNENFRYKAFHDKLIIYINVKATETMSGVQDGATFTVALEKEDDRFYRIEFWRQMYRAKDRKITEVELNKERMVFEIEGFYGTLHNWTPISRIECFVVQDGKIKNETIEFPCLEHGIRK
jgi:hypothetical protein